MPIPVLPISAIPDEVPFKTSVVLAQPPPAGSAVIAIPNDLPTYALGQSNVTVDLGGRRVGVFSIREGVHHVRITNGRIGVLETPMRNDAGTQTFVNHVTIDNIQFVGGVGRVDRQGRITDGNGLRVGSCLIANCTSIAGSGPLPGRGVPQRADGVYNCALWLDPGSHDVVVQNCDFWTYGNEACFRFASSRRTVVHKTKLGCMTQKHAYRVHGNNRLAATPNVYDSGGVASEDSWIGDCELRNRGFMLATLPDSTAPNLDRIKRAYMKRIVVTMLRNGDGQDAGFLLPLSAGQSATTPASQRLEGLIIDGVTMSGLGSANNVAAAQRRVATWGQTAGWQITNCTFTV